MIWSCLGAHRGRRALDGIISRSHAINCKSPIILSNIGLILQNNGNNGLILYNNRVGAMPTSTTTTPKVWPMGSSGSKGQARCLVQQNEVGSIPLSGGQVGYGGLGTVNNRSIRLWSWNHIQLASAIGIS